MALLKKLALRSSVCRNVACFSQLVVRERQKLGMGVMAVDCGRAPGGWGANTSPLSTAALQCPWWRSVPRRLMQNVEGHERAEAWWPCEKCLLLLLMMCRSMCALTRLAGWGRQHGSMLAAWQRIKKHPMVSGYVLFLCERTCVL